MSNTYSDLDVASDINLAYTGPQPIRIAGQEVKGNHVCAFFNHPEELYSVLLPFIREGLDRGEKALHVVSPRFREDHLQRLAAAGIKVTETCNAGQLDLRDWDELYFQDGYFDLHRMLAMWQRVLEEATQQGFPRTRLVARMDWALEDREGVSDLIEYEARFNLIRRPRDLVICVYDLKKFSGDVLVDVLRTHPMIIINGILQENPFFVPAEQFMRELSARRGRGMDGGHAWNVQPMR
jgi:hypothetical protein